LPCDGKGGNLTCAARNLRYRAPPAREPTLEIIEQRQMMLGIRMLRLRLRAPRRTSRAPRRTALLQQDQPGQVANLGMFRVESRAIFTSSSALSRSFLADSKSAEL
jgi:hypothetical protein